MSARREADSLGELDETQPLPDAYAVLSGSSSRIGHRPRSVSAASTTEAASMPWMA